MYQSVHQERQGDDMKTIGEQIIESFRGGVSAIQNDQPMRGAVWCRECGRRLVVNATKCLREGWPKCCDHIQCESPARINSARPGRDPMKCMKCGSDCRVPTGATGVLCRACKLRDRLADEIAQDLWNRYGLMDGTIQCDKNDVIDAVIAVLRSADCIVSEET